jgi:DNA primase
MKLWQEGFPNAVATLGINLSPGQYKLLAELMPKTIVLMYDNDPRGVAAMDRIADGLARIFGKNNVKKCFCPKGRDPKNLCCNEIKNLLDRLATV